MDASVLELNSLPSPAGPVRWRLMGQHPGEEHGPARFQFHGHRLRQVEPPVVYLAICSVDVTLGPTQVSARYREHAAVVDS